MKQHYLFLTLALSCICAGLTAQRSGDVIHTKFQPDSVVYYGTKNLYLDFDQDGNPDLRFYFYLTSVGGWKYVDLTTIPSDTTWMWSRHVSTDWESPYETPLSNIRYGTNNFCWRSYYDENNQHHMDSIMHGAVKYSKDGESYYGWFLAYTDSRMKYMAVKEMAFCTIPNYPLRWGQTSLTGVDENQLHHIAKLHPNPTTGVVTIVGENLHQVKVFDMLGQAISTYQVKGHSISIDISFLSIGVYFVNITDENGRRCVQKIIKE